MVHEAVLLTDPRSVLHVKVIARYIKEGTTDVQYMKMKTMLYVCDSLI